MIFGEMLICLGVCCTLKNKVAKLNHTGFWWAFLSRWHMEHIFRFLQKTTFNYLRGKITEYFHTFFIKKLDFKKT